MLNLKNVALGNRLQQITAQLAAGCITHLLGENGAGKSTLLEVMAGLLSVDNGEVTLNDKAIQEYSLAHLALIRCFHEQQPSSSFALSVGETLSFFSALNQLPDELQAALEINGFMSRSLASLSGGERQRVHIARVLLQVWPMIIRGQAMILLDEPLQGLDIRHQHLLFELLSRFALLGNLVVISHHDVALAQIYALPDDTEGMQATLNQQIWLMHKGHLLASGSAETVLTMANLKQVFACDIQPVQTESGKKLLLPHPKGIFD